MGTAGSASKATLIAQRQQNLTQTFSLQMQLTWQGAGKNLDCSEKLGFNLGAILAWAGKEAANPADNDKPRCWISAGYGW